MNETTEQNVTTRTEGPLGSSVLVTDVPITSRNRSRLRGASSSPLSTRAMARLRSRALVVLVPSRSGSQLFTTVEGRSSS